MKDSTTQDWFDTGTWVGRQQAFAVIASKCSAAQAFALKQMRESRAHENIGLTWEEFCTRHAGISRERADYYIRQLDEFGANYFNLSQIARISPEVYRQIADKVQTDTIEVDGEKIPMTLSNASRIRGAIQRLRRQLVAANAEARDATTPDVSILVSRVDALVERTEDLAQRHMLDHHINEVRGVVQYAINKWTALERRIAARTQS
ncbi:MAG TPA: hypothetical protein VLY04_04255 [Bryobacteraceae bacterium]|nr:hypothetical protein [Bryobacteraceae bacterium]